MRVKQSLAARLAAAVAAMLFVMAICQGSSMLPPLPAGAVFWNNVTLISDTA